MKKSRAVSELPVMAAHCKTCPFKPDERGRFQDPRLAAKVVERTFLKGQQICHGTEGKNREPNNRCKGAFDYMEEIYKRMGLDGVITRSPRRDEGRN